MEVSAASLSLPGFDLYQVTRVWVELGLAVWFLVAVGVRLTLCSTEAEPSPLVSLGS